MLGLNIEATLDVKHSNVILSRDRRLTPSVCITVRTVLCLATHAYQWMLVSVLAHFLIPFAM